MSPFMPFRPTNILKIPELTQISFIRLRSSKDYNKLPSRVVGECGKDHLGVRLLQVGALNLDQHDALNC